MIRNGLVYDISQDYVEEVLVYRPFEPFTVDGVEYPNSRDGYCGRAMIEMYDCDDHAHSVASTQHWSRPDAGMWIR